MAELNYTVDMDDAEEQNFEPIPAGDYTACIVESSMNETKSGTGEYLKLKYQILEGKYKNRILYEILNLINNNKDTESYARRTLNAIGAEFGFSFIDDSEQLHDKPMIIKVVQKNSDQYGVQNVIKNHSAIDGGSRETPAQEAETSATTKTAKKEMPWKPVTKK